MNDSTPIRVLIAGDGRMGSLIRSLAEHDPAFSFVAIFGEDTTDEFDAYTDKADVVIDFSHPQMLPHVCAYIKRTGAALVEGTTALSQDDFALLKDVAKSAPVLYSANYSLGVAALRHLAQQASAMIGDWDIEIVECHHNQKADAPSGTAELLRHAIDPQDERQAVYGRHGITGARTKTEIGMHSLRGGTEAGTHTVNFFGSDESVTLTHRATSRSIFAHGALSAAKKLCKRQSGYYSFDDVMFDAPEEV